MSETRSSLYDQKSTSTSDDKVKKIKTIESYIEKLDANKPANDESPFANIFSRLVRDLKEVLQDDNDATLEVILNHLNDKLTEYQKKIQDKSTQQNELKQEYLALIVNMQNKLSLLKPVKTDTDKKEEKLPKDYHPTLLNDAFTPYKIPKLNIDKVKEFYTDQSVQNTYSRETKEVKTAFEKQFNDLADLYIKWDKDNNQKKQKAIIEILKAQLFTKDYASEKSERYFEKIKRSLEKFLLYLHEKNIDIGIKIENFNEFAGNFYVCSTGLEEHCKNMMLLIESESNYPIWKNKHQDGIIDKLAEEVCKKEEYDPKIWKTHFKYLLTKRAIQNRWTPYGEHDEEVDKHAVMIRMSETEGTKEDKEHAKKVYEKFEMDFINQYSIEASIDVAKHNVFELLNTKLGIKSDTVFDDKLISEIKLLLDSVQMREFPLQFFDVVENNKYRLNLQKFSGCFLKWHRDKNTLIKPKLFDEIQYEAQKKFIVLNMETDKQWLENSWLETSDGMFAFDESFSNEWNKFINSDDVLLKFNINKHAARLFLDEIFGLEFSNESIGAKNLQAVLEKTHPKIASFWLSSKNANDWTLLHVVAYYLKSDYFHKWVKTLSLAHLNDSIGLKIKGDWTAMHLIARYQSRDVLLEIIQLIDKNQLSKIASMKNCSRDTPISEIINRGKDFDAVLLAYMKKCDIKALCEELFVLDQSYRSTLFHAIIKNQLHQSLHWIMENISIDLINQAAQLLTADKKSILVVLINSPAQLSALVLEKLSDNVLKFLIDHAKNNDNALFDSVLKHIVTQSDWKNINKKIIPLIKDECLDYVEKIYGSGQVLLRDAIDLMLPPESKEDAAFVTLLRNDNGKPPATIKTNNGKELSLADEKKENLEILYKNGISENTFKLLDRYYPFHSYTQIAYYLDEYGYLESGFSLDKMTIDFISNELKVELVEHQKQINLLQTDAELDQYSKTMKKGSKFIILDGKSDKNRNDEKDNSKVPVILFNIDCRKIQPYYGDRSTKLFHNWCRITYSNDIDYGKHLVSILEDVPIISMFRFLKYKNNNNNTFFHEVATFFPQDYFEKWINSLDPRVINDYISDENLEKSTLLHLVAKFQSSQSLQHVLGKVSKETLSDLIVMRDANRRTVLNLMAERGKNFDTILLEYMNSCDIDKVREAFAIRNSNKVSLLFLVINAQMTRSLAWIIKNIDDKLFSKMAKVLTKNKQSIFSHLIDLPVELSADILKKIENNKLNYLIGKCKQDKIFLFKFLDQVFSQAEWSEVNKKIIPMLKNECMDYINKVYTSGRILRKEVLDLLLPEESKHEDEWVKLLRDDQGKPPVTIKTNSGETLSLLDEKKGDVDTLYHAGMSLNTFMQLQRYYPFHRLTQVGHCLQQFYCLGKGYPYGQFDFDFISNDLLHDLNDYQQTLQATETNDQIEACHLQLSQNTKLVFYGNHKSDKDGSSKSVYFALDKEYKNLFPHYLSSSEKLLNVCIYINYNDSLKAGLQLQEIFENTPSITVESCLDRSIKPGWLLFHLAAGLLPKVYFEKWVKCLSPQSINKTLSRLTKDNWSVLRLIVNHQSSQSLQYVISTVDNDVFSSLITDKCDAGLLELIAKVTDDTILLEIMKKCAASINNDEFINPFYYMMTRDMQKSLIWAINTISGPILDKAIIAASQNAAFYIEQVLKLKFIDLNYFFSKLSPGTIVVIHKEIIKHQFIKNGVVINVYKASSNYSDFSHVCPQLLFLSTLIIQKESRPWLLLQETVNAKTCDFVLDNIKSFHKTCCYLPIISALAEYGPWLKDSAKFSKIMPLIYDDLLAYLKHNNKQYVLDKYIMKHRISLIQHKLPTGIKHLYSLQDFSERKNFDDIKDYCSIVLSNEKIYKYSKLNQTYQAQLDKIEDTLFKKLTEMKEDKTIQLNHVNNAVFAVVKEIKEWCEDNVALVGCFFKAKCDFQQQIDFLYDALIRYDKALSDTESVNLEVKRSI